ncbi:MAG: hypothetical protein A2428_10385 [Bdellovibrionales bacterium RIFOXYC1_FULL_54_43]|nr:MAG: hypothetical protein A2428_10385 [Bdellovibrionales bacterium RIFOXYC1_FULL_54_43]OFZ80392.1 MAG: hypothetical protein A2603_13510 [Bdellovibrionales bacterium RIFOXYD1_FULL_55_31]
MLIRTKQMSVVSVFLVTFVWAFLTSGDRALAYVLSIPPQLSMEVLSESVPTAFAPTDFNVGDFRIEWIGEPIPGVTVRIEERSLEWVRVSELLVLPRARILFEMDRIEGGRITSAGFSQAVSVQGGHQGRAEIPVALISGDQNPIELRIRPFREGVRAPDTGVTKDIHGKLRVVFRPRSESKTARVYLDTSCSRYGLKTESLGFKADEWVYIGCRMVHTESIYRTSSLEVLVYWDNVGQSILVGGIETPSSSVSLWPLRLYADPGTILLRAGSHEMRLRYSIPRQLHHGAVSLGIGPYAFNFRDESHEVSNTTLMPTLYSSYFITESMRLVAFGAVTANAQLISDFGVYLSSEYIRTLDRRVAVNLMLGVHSIAFRTGGQYYFLLGAPQGAEVVVYDFLGRARNLTLGGFVYPSIQGKAYYNTWIRWGSGALFGEINYIAWEEKLDSEQYSSRSMGVTLGFPLGFLGFL